MRKSFSFTPASQVITCADNGVGLELDDLSKETLRNAFSNSHINILLGAGFCAGLLPTLGNREQWLEWCHKHKWQDPVFAEFAEALLQLEYFKNVLLPMRDIAPTTEMLDFCDHLKRIIETRGTTTIPRRACLFTTNYDPMIELALERSGCAYNDGFEGRVNPVFAIRSFSRTQYQQSLSMEYSAQVPTLNVIKLHGSVTWGKSHASDNICFHNYIEALDSFAGKASGTMALAELPQIEQIVKSQVKEAEGNLVRVVEGLSGKDASNLVDYLADYHRAFYLINPTKRKFEETVLGLTYYELLRLYANELDRNNALLISFGFSFEDEHILDITRRALENPQLILLVCCHKEVDLEKYQEKFQHASNVWYVVPSGGEFALEGFCKILNGVR
ncbi:MULTISPECIES: SIR2 family protein [unclassified Adlercreutzia]|uniref:SIR2 family protein n=1 Tax=unclassified Adlercreutzia TaxID=2636013 RepID=UPI0013EC1F02|nr:MULTISPECIES: SIR2 family protein [unclassified Adlercreutzia]